MPDDFLDYIKRRRAELLREINELDAAERTYLRSRSIREQMPPEPKPDPIGVRGMFTPVKKTLSFPASRITVKDIVLDVLSKFPDGLTALQLLDKINMQFHMNIARTSLSPQLSRLKNEGLILNDRQVWKPINKDAPAADSANGASK